MRLARKASRHKAQAYLTEDECENHRLYELFISEAMSDNEIKRVVRNFGLVPIFALPRPAIIFFGFMQHQGGERWVILDWDFLCTSHPEMVLSLVSVRYFSKQRSGDLTGNHPSLYFLPMLVRYYAEKIGYWTSSHLVFREQKNCYLSCCDSEYMSNGNYRHIKSCERLVKCLTGKRRSWTQFPTQGKCSVLRKRII